MNIQNKLKDLKDQKSYSSPAKSVMTYLKPILSRSNELRHRWMWELLQNASDLGDNIKTKFIITENELVFKHNGKPFTLEEAYNLIMPDSTKDGETGRKKSVIGQFGSGFISTHILSRVIQISGIIEDDKQFYNFSFHLDRSERENKDFLIESIKKSEAEYRENLKELDVLPNDEFQTSFTYTFNNTYSNLNGREVVDDGIKSFKELIPFVLTFRPQLNEIEIIDHRNGTNKWTYQRDEVESDIDDLIIIKTTYLKNGQHIEDKLIGNIIEKETEIAFPIAELDQDKFQLLSFPENCPILFCAFPMIGTNDFNFPVVIHSEKFVPNSERDGIEISEYDKENRARLIEAKDAFLRLLEIIEEFEWTDAFNISSLYSPDFNDFAIKTWFTNLIFKPIKENLLKTKMVELDDSLDVESKRLSLSEVYIPYADRRLKNYTELVNKIYNLAFKTIPTLLPKREHFLHWFEILDFEIFTEEKLDLEELTKKITQDVNSLGKFCSEYSMNEADAIKYLIEYIKFILEQKEDELLDDYKLILNQQNELCFLKGIKLDRIYHKGLKDGYDEKLKDIYNSLSDKDCRAVMLHKDFEQIDGLIAEKDTFEFRELAKESDEELRNYKGNFQDEDFLLILKDLFSWYTTCGLSEDTLMNLFPFFSLNKSQLYLNTKTPEELEYAFDIEISGKSEVLSKIAKSELSKEKLEIIAENPELVSSFIEWLQSRKQDHPDEELGNIGEEFLYYQLCKIFGTERVKREDRPEFDFRVLEKDLDQTKYYIDAKTTASGIANSDNVPFYMRMAQWRFLDSQQAHDKYIIARVFKNGGSFDVKYIKLEKQTL